MNEVLTLAQIGARFDAEWILLADPEVNEHLEIQRGRIVCHSKDRDEVYQRAIELRLKSSATLYTGKIPENAAVML